MRFALVSILMGGLGLCLVGNDDGATSLNPRPEEPSACAGVCAAVAPKPPDAADAAIERWLADYKLEPERDDGPAFETLLYHGAAVADYARRRGLDAVPEAHRERLERELRRRHVTIALRVVDDAGRERLQLEPTRIPLDRKSHLRPTSTDGLPAPEIALTPRRVGRSHVWVRL